MTIASDISVWEVQYNLVFISSILNADDSQLSEGGHESEDAKESESHSAIDEPQTETPTAAETDQTETVDASEADQPENKVGVNYDLMLFINFLFAGCKSLLYMYLVVHLLSIKNELAVKLRKCLWTK